MVHYMSVGGVTWTKYILINNNITLAILNLVLMVLFSTASWFSMLLFKKKEKWF